MWHLDSLTHIGLFRFLEEYEVYLKIKNYWPALVISLNYYCFFHFLTIFCALDGKLFYCSVTASITGKVECFGGGCLFCFSCD